MRRHAFKDRPIDTSLELKESIDGRDFYVALASAALALGYAEAAGPFAAQAAFEAPRDAEVQLGAGLRGIRPGRGEGPPTPRRRTRHVRARMQRRRSATPSPSIP